MSRSLAARRLSGQAMRLIFTFLHGTVAVAMTAALIGGLGAGALAWRLSRGPLVLPWLAGRMEAAADPALAPARLRIGRAELAWEGFHSGMAAPLDLRLDDVALLDKAGAPEAAVPRAAVTLSIPALLRLRLAPRDVVLDGPVLVLRRAPDGTIGLAIGTPVAPPATGAPATATTASFDPAAILAELARPPAGARVPRRFGLFSQLRGIMIRNADLILEDPGRGTVWRAPGTRIALLRGATGGVSGTAALGVAFGKAVARIALGVDLPPGGTEARLTARLAPIAPAALAGAAPSLAPLAAIDAPVGGIVSLRIGAGGRARDLHVALSAGAGALRFAGGTVALRSGSLAAGYADGRLAIDRLALVLSPGAKATPTEIVASGTLSEDPNGVVATVSLGFDQADFATLGALWPPSLAADARKWIVTNMTSGVARDGRFSFGLRAGPGFAHPALFEAAGNLRASGLTVHWLRPIPPLVDGVATMQLVTPDRIVVAVSGGRQSMPPGTPFGLVAESGALRFDGLTLRDQVAHIEARIVGPLPAAIALLKEPRLGLLARHPMPLHDPAGQAAVRLSLTVPLEKHLTLEQVGIGVAARLSGVHLARIAAGRDLDGATLDLTANPRELHLTGNGRWAGLPLHLDGSMDFRPGPASEVTQRLTATGQVDAAALRGAGLDLGAAMTGTAALSAEVTERRSGAGGVALRADLTGAGLALAALGWSKPAGQAQRLSLDLPLVHDRLEGAAPVALAGAAEGRATARFAGGALRALDVARLRLGGSDLSGSASFPADGGAVAVRIDAPVLDLAARFAARRQPTPRAPRKPPKPGRAWSIAARIGILRLAGGAVLRDVVVDGENDGLDWRRLNFDAAEPGTARASLRIAPAGAGRSFNLTAGDAGVLARGFGLPVSLTGGKLAVHGGFAPGPGGALSGTAELTDFRLRDAPAVARLLQAVTLYGLAEIMQGPGLGVTRLTAPFTLGDGVLTLKEARAFSPSVGATAEGTADLDAQRLDLRGTVVPAYFFNTLLGRLPIVGRLFSPEKGGGVFAARYSVRGPMADPDVSVNPLSALTPGFLRELFGLF